ncbi:MAG: sensor domain-containing diguanylate cyclase [Pseudomonadota bacterium]
MSLRDSIELEESCRQALQIFAEAIGLAPEAERGIFLVRGNDMKLVASNSIPPGFAEAHEGIQVGTCLCGLAAAEGKIITTAQCAHDPRHTLAWSLKRPHGHLIIPLKARGSVVGVLYCYLAENTVFEARKLKLFEAIGDQLGSAIENARLYEEKRQAALHDALTGLDNRLSMDLTLARLLAEARRYRRPLAVAMADIDFFKKFNDSYGHQAGDALLTEVAQRLRCGTREADMVARYGGEEFLLLLPHTTLEQAAALAERLRQTIESSTPVTISIGVAALGPQHDSQDTLIKAADDALYRAKQSGRNRVVTQS